MGHYAGVCKTKPSNDSETGNKSSDTKRALGETKYLEEVVEEDTEDDEVLGIFAANDSAKDGHTLSFVSVLLDQKGCKMHLDTGATVSILRKVLYDQQFNQWPLRGTKIKLKAHNGVRIPVYGEVYLPVVYEWPELMLPLIVVDGDGPPLLGRNWLEQLKLNWRNIFHVSKADTLFDVLSRYKMVFDKGLGTVKGFKADIQLQDGAKPIFCKARTVPYACTTPKGGRRIRPFGEVRSRKEGGTE